MAAAWRALALVALATLAAAGCGLPGASAVPAPHRTVEVALVDVFSGVAAESGRDLRNGLELQAGVINAAGGLLGSRVEVVAADGEANPAKAAELARQELGDAGVGLVVGPNTTAAFQAVRPALEAAGVADCLTRVSDDALAAGRSTFRVGAANSAEVAVLLNAVRRVHPDVHKIGLLDEGDELGRSYDSQLTAQSGGAGIGYVGHAVAGADGDQRAALQQLVGLGAQVVVLSQQTAGAIRAAQADTQLGAGRPALAGFGALAKPTFVSVGGEAAVGAILATTQQASLTSAPQAQWPAGYHEFVASAGQLYGLGTDGVQPLATPAGADCLLQWARAVRIAKTFKGPAVARAWETLDLSADETALGVRERVTTGDHNAVAQDQLMAYTWANDGSRTLLQRVPAS